MASSPNGSSRRRIAKRKGSERPELDGPGAGELILTAGITLPRDFDPHEDVVVPGVRDLRGVLAIEERVEKHIEGFPNASVASLCGLLVYELTTRRPFDLGLNYPAALRTVHYTVRMNRWRFDLAERDWSAFLGDVARGDLTEEQFAALVASFLRPRSLRAM